MTIRHATLAALALLASLPAHARAPGSLSASGDAVLFTLGATGVQVYECRQNPAGTIAGPCLAAGAVAEVPYAADYVMLRSR